MPEGRRSGMEKPIISLTLLTIDIDVDLELFYNRKISEE